MAPLAPGLLSTTTCCPSVGREPLRDQTTHDVDRAAGREWNDQPDRLARVGLRAGRIQRESGEAERQDGRPYSARLRHLELAVRNLSTLASPRAARTALRGLSPARLELIIQCRHTPQSTEDQRNWHYREPGPDDRKRGPGG